MKKGNKIDFVSLNKGDYKYKPYRVQKNGSTSPTRFEKVVNTKISPTRPSINGQSLKPNSLYHKILDKKTTAYRASPIREPKIVYEAPILEPETIYRTSIHVPKIIYGASIDEPETI